MCAVKVQQDVCSESTARWCKHSGYFGKHKMCPKRAPNTSTSCHYTPRNLSLATTVLSSHHTTCNDNLPLTTPTSSPPRHYSHLITTPTSSPLPPHHHSHLVTTTTSHHYHLITTTTSSALPPCHHSHLITTTTSSPLPPHNQFMHCFVNNCHLIF